MKRFPWRLALALPLIAMTAVACDPTEDDDPETTYPSDNLSVTADQNIFVVERTNVDCGSCITTQEATEVMKTLYPERIIPMSLHTTDTLYTDFNLAVEATLGIDAGNTFNLFINHTQVASNPYEIVQDIIDGNIPSGVGVNHATGTNDTAWIIYPKVKFFADNQSDLYVQSYVMLDGVVAKQYAGVDLTQQSTDSRVTTGANGSPTYWNQNGGQTGDNEYLYSANTTYLHHDDLLAAGVNDTSEYGIPLSTINPLGQSFFNGDIFGNQYTPIEIFVPFPDFDIASAVGADLKVVTIVWERIPGSPDVYSFVNGYYSEM